MYSEPSQTSRMQPFAKTILAFSAPCYTFEKNLNMSLNCIPEKEFKTTFKGNFYLFLSGSIYVIVWKVILQDGKQLTCFCFVNKQWKRLLCFMKSSNFNSIV